MDMVGSTRAITKNPVEINLGFENRVSGIYRDKVWTDLSSY